MRPQIESRRLIQLLIVNAIVITLVVLWNRSQHELGTRLAVAKGQQLLDMPSTVAGYPQGYTLDTAAIERQTLADSALAASLAGKRMEFLAAVPLTEGEARYWQAQDCGRLNCALVTFYNYTDRGTVEVIVQLQRGEVLAHWTNAAGRPGASGAILPRALAIAAADAQVRSILGDNIGAADPLMIPMSGWLVDDACREEWCVDLTFHDPAGTGRIYHVFVNLEREEVARAFYTRARADRSPAAPLAQRDAFSDGCHQQHGWNVCWEMTANDGINFRDATFNGRSIFSSAKIGQIEAWYPSWPGGYRDEIGFAATVPPFGGTEIIELDGGFEIRQLFTEFTRWPNCICCYRYEEAIQFYADGRLEFRFVSHGPGCDDLSIYRPFWRIDVDLDNPEGEQVWLFDGAQWVESVEEFETYPVVENLSPEGHKLATFDGDLHYRWAMERTDPLGLDEGYLFLLQWGAMEGEGPISTGPGDTFIPPRQWIDGDPLSGENIVLWHVPILNTKQGRPWWCMPDPDPEFSPCEAILRADPAGELRQPTAEEAAELAAQNAATPTAAPATVPAPTVTPRPIQGETAEEIILNAGCGSCHKIDTLGEAHKVGPDLTYIGLTAAERVPDMTAEEYIRQSIHEPNAYLAPECPNAPCMPNIMPQNFATRLSADQVDTLVIFLLARQGPSPTPVTVGAATPAPKVGGAAKVTAPLPAPALTSTVVGILVILLVGAISLFLIFRQRPD